MNELLFLAALIVDPVGPSVLNSDINAANKSTIQVATTCFKSGEQISGMNKICYYNCMGSTVAINVRSLEFCPMSIRN
jgi:hypothetical protein